MGIEDRRRLPIGLKQMIDWSQAFVDRPVAVGGSRRDCFGADKRDQDAVAAFLLMMKSKESELEEFCIVTLS